MIQEKKNDKKTVEETEEVLFHQPGKPTVGSKHNWKQRGQMLVCDSCESSHGIRLKQGYQMCGVDENGMPTITQVW
jgi:hypothetical protein